MCGTCSTPSAGVKKAMMPRTAGQKIQRIHGDGANNNSGGGGGGAAAATSAGARLDRGDLSSRGGPTASPRRDWGFCFVCSGTTFKECIKRGLFGSTYHMLDEMRDTIVIGETKIFLLNFDNMRLFGSFVATSHPAHMLEPTAWVKGNGNGKSPFPAQVRVKRLNSKKVAVHRGFIQQGPMEPALVLKVIAMLGLETHDVPRTTKPPPAHGVARSSSTSTSKERSSSAVLPPQVRVAHPAPTSTRVTTAADASPVRTSLPAVPTVTTDVKNTFRSYKKWIQQMEDYFEDDAPSPQMVADADKLVANAELFLNASKAGFEKKYESIVGRLQTATTDFLGAASKDHEQQLADELKRHTLALKNIEAIRQAKLGVAENQHLEDFKRIQVKHDAAVKRIPSVKILREHVERARMRAENAQRLLREEEDRRRVEEVSALKLQLDLSHKERKVALDSAARIKSKMEKEAKAMEGKLKNAATERHAAMEAAEEEEMALYLKRLAQRKAAINQLFNETNESMLQTASKAKEDFKKAYAEATATRAKQDREAKELSSKLSKLTYVDLSGDGDGDGDGDNDAHARARARAAAGARARARAHEDEDDTSDGGTSAFPT